MASGCCVSPVYMLVAALLATLLRGAWARVLVDMTQGRNCGQTELSLPDNEIYTLYAEYNANHASTLDHCDVAFRATERVRHVQYLVDQFDMSDCGVELLVFDDPRVSTTPSRTFTCSHSQSVPIEGRSSDSTIKFSLRKASAQASVMNIRIQVKNDYGPSFTFIKNQSEFYEAPLDTGAIVGIAIAGCILIIALVGIAIYCCLKNRQDMKYAEASDARSAPSVFTSGTSQVMYGAGRGANGQHKSGGGGGKYGSMEDIRSYASSTDRANNAFANKAYEADGYEKRPNRSGSIGKRGGQRNAAFDESDTHVSEGSHHARYNKNQGHSRNEDYEMNKVNPMPNGILKTRSRSPNRSHSSTEGSTVDSNAMVQGYSKSGHAHPNVQHIPVLERSRSRPRSSSTGRSRTGSIGRSRSGSFGRSRTGSFGKAGKDKDVPKVRQYSDMSQMLRPKESSHRSRPRSRSTDRGSVGRRARSDSHNSEKVPSEVSFAPSGASSRKTGGGKRAHFQTVQSDI